MNPVISIDGRKLAADLLLEYEGKSPCMVRTNIIQHYIGDDVDEWSENLRDEKLLGSDGKPITCDDCVLFAVLVHNEVEYISRVAKFGRSYFYEGLENGEIAWGS